ncbi:MAG: MmgE/PrpD family protein [Pseudomonadota bacterium]
MIADYARWIAHAPSISQSPDSETALTAIKASLADTLSCMAAAACRSQKDDTYEHGGEQRPDPMPALGRWLGAQEASTGSVVAGLNMRTTPTLAAFFNATAAHAYDFDDDFDPAKAHPSAVLWPAIIAVSGACERAGESISMANLFDAYAIGLDGYRALGEQINPEHRNRGWHATSTIGAVATTGAVMRLVGGDEETNRNALSLACSRAGGTMAQFGTPAKPLHAGFAAETSVRAAELARAGIAASPKAWDGPHGVALLMGEGEVPRSSISTPAFEERRSAVIDPGLKFKLYPNCASAHRAMWALGSLRGAHGFRADDIAAITVSLPAAHLANLSSPEPISPEQARFSMPHACAAVLAADPTSVTAYQMPTVRDPKITAIRSQVTVRAAAPSNDQVDGYGPALKATVSVQLHSGPTLTASCSSPPGRGDNPCSNAVRAQKFTALLGLAGVPEDRAREWYGRFTGDTPVTLSQIEAFLRQPAQQP